MSINLAAALGGVKDPPPDVGGTDGPRPLASPPAATQPDVGTMVAKARRGCPVAWSALFNRYNRLVLSVARRHGLTPAECDDVAQFTWLRLFENIGRIRSDTSLAGWLVTTSTRESYATTRRRSRELPTAAVHDLADPGTLADLDALLDIQAATAALHRMIRVLPARERQLMELLLHPAELTYRQISQALEMPVGAIGPVRQRAIRRLQGLFAGQSPWGGEGSSVAAA
jgi:RNA polymerase sigma factor (sigma-70 family)